MPAVYMITEWYKMSSWTWNILKKHDGDIWWMSRGCQVLTSWISRSSSFWGNQFDNHFISFSQNQPCTSLRNLWGMRANIWFPFILSHSNVRSLLKEKNKTKQIWFRTRQNSSESDTCDNCLCPRSIGSADYPWIPAQNKKNALWGWPALFWYDTNKGPETAFAAPSYMIHHPYHHNLFKIW